MTTLLSITSTSQLSDFCAAMIPCIWVGTKEIFHPKRHTQFRNYVYKVLKATQLSCTCIIVALYYIQRLRIAYPSIQASEGSEVRLFTTALVLANKFLDDNTFTNKTWSEVSSIPVKELNIMEMEFLNALNYNIHVQYQIFLTWTEQCQVWWNKHNQPPVVIASKKRPLDTPSIEFTYNKKRQLDDRYSMYYTPPICKPILSWSSSISAISTANQQFSLPHTNNTTTNTYQTYYF